jgi:hypothetical protein
MSCFNHRVPVHLVSASLACTAAPAFASCGSDFCSLLNDRFAMGTWDHVGWSADLRLESVRQNRLRSGTHSIAPADVTGEGALERRTTNTNLLTTLERSFDMNWSVSLRVPLVRRDHQHDLIDQTTGDLGPSEAWRFTRLGDVQWLARWQDAADAPNSSWAVTAGFKLPTGSHTVRNHDGTLAERSLQPGTGTTDLVLGTALRRMLSGNDALNLQATWTHPLDSRDNYKPGARVELGAGWSHAIDARFSTVLQANFVRKARDRGDQAEPDNSGSTTLWLSPGLSAAVGARALVYGLVQLPLYQRVNGIQLVARTSWAAGYARSF